MEPRIFTSPDGLFRVEFNEFTMRMSHIVCNPRVIHVPSGKTLLDRFGTLWDGEPSVDGDRLHIALREYSGLESDYTLVYDPTAGTVTRIQDGKSETWSDPVLTRFVGQPQPQIAAAPVIPSSSPSSSPVPLPLALTPNVHIPSRRSLLSVPPLHLVLAIGIPLVLFSGGAVLAKLPPFNHLPFWSAYRMGVAALTLILGGLLFVFFKWMYRPDQH